MKKRFVIVCPFFLLLLLLVGCGDKEKLGGKVTFPDGQPLETGIIYFSNENVLARAMIRSNGTYDVGSLSQKDGLPPGTYKVYIFGAVKAEQDPKDPDKESFAALIAPEFASQDTTPLTVTVPGEKVYDIVVERPASAKK